MGRKNNRGVTLAVKTLKKVVSEAEKKHIKSVLELTGRNVQHTARLLDVARNTIVSKIKKYEL